VHTLRADCQIGITCTRIHVWRVCCRICYSTLGDVDACAPTRCRIATVQYSSGRDTGFTASRRALSVSWRLTDFLVVAKP
jgi:hypothetical protein